MKKALFSILLSASCAAPVVAADVGVTITLGQPGFYGQVELGSIPRPPVIYAQPVVVAQAPEFVSAPPIYLHVPPGHEKHWSKHCAEYHACGRPVYFVRHEWYNNEYVPRYRHDHDGDRDHDHGHGHDHDRDHDNGRHHDRDHDEDHDH